MRSRHLLIVQLWIFTSFFFAELAHSAPPQSEFDTYIAPLLATHCLECHSSTHAEGGLDLSTKKAATEGGDSGVVFDASDWQSGLLWQFVESDEMPKDRPALSREEKEQLKRWLESGGGWTSPRIDPMAYSSERRAGYDWWSLQPVSNPQLPSVKTGSWPKNEIDFFVLSKLEEHRLQPAPAADRRTLIRRLTFDLIGLPPRPEDVESFLRDKDDDAYERLVDRLLDSPNYGERWARHWLDVVRFGETQGYERNRIRENAWQYRDWVIRAFNQDLPYDKFVRMQIAGDVLDPDSFDALMATGYHVCGTWDQVGHKEGSQEMRKAARWDHIEDLVGTMGQAFLGLTTNCARCHDHKYDPISQQEYYQLAATLGGVTQQEKERGDIKNHADNSFNGTAHVIIPQQPPVYHVLLRGDYRKEGDVVQPRGLAALSSGGLEADFHLAADSPEAQRRVALANWLSDTTNPLTARVIVNRFWHYHFGRGIVDTPSDFGFSGGRPSHPEMLDWLANDFMRNGWKMKDLHRKMVLSATYRQASNVINPEARELDSENRWLWRANLRRLEGEAIRDASLFVSGQLNLKMCGPSFYDMKVKAGNNAEFTDSDDTFTEATNRRTIYRLWARSGNNPLLSAFDCPDPSVMTPIRTRTITPLQSMLLMNNSRMEKCGAHVAKRVQETTKDVDQQLVKVWDLLFCRTPSEAELKMARKFTDVYGLEQLCLVLLNSNEFIYVN